MRIESGSHVLPPVEQSDRPYDGLSDEVKRLAAELDCRTDELLSILEATDYGIVFVDRDERVRYANHRLRQLFELPEDLLVRGAGYVAFLQHLRSCGLDPDPRQIVHGSGAEVQNESASVELTWPGSPPRHFLWRRQVVRSSSGERIGRLETFREVTEHRRVERRQDELLTRMEQDRRRLQALERITRIGLSTSNVPAMGDVLLQPVLKASHAQAGALLLLEPPGDRLVVAGSGFANREGIADDRVPVDEGLAGRVTQSRQPVTLTGSDVEAEPAWSRLGDSKPQALMGLPLEANGRLIGVLILGYARTASFGADDLAVLQILADRIALVIENARLVEYTARQAYELNALLDNLTEAIVVTEPTGRVVRMNKTALRMFGQPVGQGQSPAANEGLRLSIFDMRGRPIPPDQTPLARAARGEAFSEEDLWVTGLDGVRRRVAVGGGPVRDETGTVLFGFNVFRDVTDLRELEWSERALAEENRVQREFLEGLFQAAPIGITVVNEPGHVIRMANPIARKWWGMEDPLAKAYAVVDPSPEAQQTLDRAVATGQPQTVQDREMLGLGRESRFFSTTFLPLAEAGKAADRVLIVTWETTDTIRSRQRAEQLAGLAEQHSDELEAVIAQLPEGVVIVDAPSGQIRMLNPAALSMAAWHRSGPEGQGLSVPTFETLRPNGEPFGEDDPLRAALTQGKIAPGVEAQLRQQDGKSLPVLISAAPLRDPAGRVTGAVLTLRDITALKQVDRLKDEFLSMASHELKTPLTAVKGFSQLLLRRAQRSKIDDERTLRALETIDEKVNYMSRLIGDLLDLSRVETDRLELQPVATDLVALARTTVSELQMITEKHQLVLATDLDELVGYWDHGRIEQVLINLIDNAIKYSPGGGAVTVRVARDGDKAQVSVTDEGMGIPGDQQGRLFERFYRAHDDRMAIGGLGLGLYLSSEIVRRHGGQIGVKSAEKEGSTFWFRLPSVPVPEGDTRRGG